MASSSTQKEDWEDSLTSLMQKMTLSPITVGSTMWVEVTHINNPNSFYVRATSYNRYLPALQAVGSEIEMEQLYIGNVVVFKSKIHNCFVRGQIIFIDKDENDTKLKLFAMDYGNIESDVPVTSVNNPLYTNYVPPLVHHCQLELCHPPKDDFWSKESIDAMKFYIGDERTKIIVQEKQHDLLTVLMYNSCPEDISTMLALLGYSALSTGNNSVNRFSAVPEPKQAYYLFQSLKIDDSLQVRVQGGRYLTGFYVAEVNSYQTYLEQRENIAYFARQADAIRSEDLYEGKPVCVPTEKRYGYERAIIKEVDETQGKAVVQLVDWGDILQVSVDRIKPIRESFLTLPAIAIYCAADETQTWDNGLQKFLYPGYSFIIKIKTVGEAFNTPSKVNIFKIDKSKAR